MDGRGAYKVTLGTALPLAWAAARRAARRGEPAGEEARGEGELPAGCGCSPAPPPAGVPLVRGVCPLLAVAKPPSSCSESRLATLLAAEPLRPLAPRRSARSRRRAAMRCAAVIAWYAQAATGVSD